MKVGARSRNFAGITGAVVLVALAASGSAQAALRAPAPQAPAASASVETMPTFTWKAVRGAAKYEFQLSDDAKFNSIVLGRGRGRGSQQTLNTAATLDKAVPDGNYFWRVRAITAKERVGAWSKSRALKKHWKTAPELKGPADDFAVSWPSSPLVLSWAPVKYATKYLVTIATDPTLAQLVGTPSNKALEIPGTSFALQGTLPAGRYYWAITPVDAGGLRGTRSRVASFTWSWPTATPTGVVDLNDTAQVMDPQLNWNLVPGAARYEVEINPDDDFAAGSRVCCKDPVIGTSLSPVRILPNNSDVLAGSSGYHWRVRAYDTDGNPGQWNRGPTFEKAYDNVTPTVPNVAVETVPSTDGATASPLVTWDPVPGAAQYQVQWARHTFGCSWGESQPVKTSALAWTPLSPTIPTVSAPGGPYSAAPTRSGQPFAAERVGFPVVAFEDGVRYCVRVRALSDDSLQENDNATKQVISRWSQVGGGENTPAFTYGGPPAPPDPATSPVPLATPAYLNPAGATVTRTPVLRWAPVTGARRYFVLIARDANFTNVIHAAFTAMPAYAPNLVLEDEQTSYFWVVVPTNRSNGESFFSNPLEYNPQSFRKLSLPPAPAQPAGGVDVASQPVFRWTPAEAAQKYRLQVSADPQFGDLLDDVLTSSTAYTSSTPYPADTALYWRVRAEQLDPLRGSTRVELRWSTVESFRRRLQAPALDDTIALSGELPPLLTWSAVPGAVSYDLRLEEGDGDTNDFNVRSAAATFTKFFGIGTFKFRVRANFASRSGVVASAFSAPRDFTRLISPPSSPRVIRSGTTRLAFGWSPAAAASSYRVEVSTTESFTRVIESVKTSNTSWAPELRSPFYKGSGPLYWRVATVDDGNNIGAFISSAVRKGKTMTVRVRGSLRRNATSRITVSVRGSGRALALASVRASGAGAKTATRRTGKRGTALLALRPTKTGYVTIVVKRTGYADRTVRVRVR